MEAAEYLTLYIDSRPPLFRAKIRQKFGPTNDENSNLFQSLPTDLEKLISLLDDAEIDQSIAHRIEQTCWSKEDKIVELMTVLRIEDRIQDMEMVESLVSTVNKLNAGVRDMLFMLRGYTTIDEDARWYDEPVDEISPILRAIAKYIVSLCFTGRVSDY